LIGAGSFGKVYLGMDATNGLLMAVKQVEVPTTASDERKKSMTDALEREIELLRDLEHENIVQYLCASLSGL
jgi:mitogen-activated protein kinase kinase kinase